MKPFARGWNTILNDCPALQVLMISMGYEPTKISYPTFDTFKPEGVKVTRDFLYDLAFRLGREYTKWEEEEE